MGWTQRLLPRGRRLRSWGIISRYARGPLPHILSAHWVWTVAAFGSGREWEKVGSRAEDESGVARLLRTARWPASSVSRRKLTTQQALLRHSSAGGFLGGRRSFQGHSTSGPCSRRLLALGLSGRIVVRTWPSPHGRAHAVLLAARAPCAGQAQAFYPPWSEDISGSLLTSTA